MSVVRMFAIVLKPQRGDISNQLTGGVNMGMGEYGGMPGAVAGAAFGRDEAVIASPDFRQPRPP